MKKWARLSPSDTGRHRLTLPAVAGGLQTRDFNTLAGVKGFVLVPWKADAVQPWDADHREYRVGYATRVGDYMDPAGRHDEIVDVSRNPGGPWRVGYIGDGM